MSEWWKDMPLAESADVVADPADWWKNMPLADSESPPDYEHEPVARQPEPPPAKRPIQQPEPEEPIQQPGPVAPRPEGRSLEFQGTIYRFGPEWTDQTLKPFFDKIFVSKRQLSPEEAGGRSLLIDSPSHIESRRNIPISQAGLEGYAELLSGKDAEGKPVVVKPEDVTPQALAQVIETRKKYAAECENEPNINPVALRQFKEDTAAMERDVERSWPNETTVEGFTRRYLDKMKDAEVIESGQVQAQAQGLPKPTTIQDARQMLITDRAGARTPEIIAADEAILEKRPVSTRTPRRSPAEWQLQRDLYATATELIKALHDRAASRKILATVPQEQWPALIEAGRELAAAQKDVPAEGLLARTGLALGRGATGAIQAMGETLGGVPLWGSVVNFGTEEEQEVFAQFGSLREQASPANRPDDPYWKRTITMTAGMMPDLGLSLGLLAKYGIPGAMAYWYAREYPENKREFKEMGFEGKKATALAATTSLAVAAIEMIERDPTGIVDKAGLGAAKKGLKQRLFALAKDWGKRTTREWGEEHAQAYTKAAIKTTSAWADENIEDLDARKEFTEAFWEGMEAGGPVALITGVPASVRGASEIASAKLTQLQQVRSKGFVTRADGEALSLTEEELKNRSTRKAAVEDRIQQAEKEIQDARPISGLEKEVREEPGREDIHRPGEVEVRPEPPGEVAPARAEEEVRITPEAPETAVEARKPKEAPEPVSPVETPPAAAREAGAAPEAPADYSGMAAKELAAEAKKRGLKGYSGKKKAVVRGMLEEADREAAPPVSEAPAETGLEAKEQWEMTKAEAADQLIPEDQPIETPRFWADEHKSEVEAALAAGKPVPRNIVEEYKGEPWADKYLAERAAPAVSEGREGVKEPWEMTDKDWQYKLAVEGRKQAGAKPPPSKDKFTLLEANSYLHRTFVESAIEEGKSVPAEVLAEYPDLVSKPAAQEAETAKPKTKLQQAAEKATRDAVDELDAFGKVLRGKGLAMNPMLDPEVVAGAAKLTAKFAKAGTLKFAAFLEQVAKSIGQAATDRLRPLLESKWEELRKTGEVPGMEAPPSGATGTKNVKTEELRAEADLGKRVRGEPESVEQWEAEAAQRIAADPLLPGRLAAELARKPRAIDEVDQAVLGQYTRDLENRRKAGEDVRDEMRTVAEANEKVGEKWSRSGTARQTELEADFTVAGLTKKHIKAVKKPPSDEQMAEYEELANEIEKLEGELKESQQETAQAEIEKRIAEAAVRKKAPPPRPKKGTKRARLQREASDAVAAFKSEWTTLFQLGAVHDPKQQAEKWAKITKAAGEVVRAYGALGVDSFLGFMGKVRKDFGDINSDQEEAFKEAWRKARTQGVITSPLGDNPKASEIGALASQLTVQAVESGIEGWENVTDAVHEELQDMGLEISRSETMQAMSQYGVYRRLSKDEVKVKVRAIKGQVRQVLKIEDLENAIALSQKWLDEGMSPEDVARKLRDDNLLPKASGWERPTPDSIERALIAQVNELKKTLPVPVESREGQLKSALSTAKTAIRNRIADLEQEIATREKIIKERTSLQPDAELVSLREKRDELLKEHKKIFPPKKSPLSAAQRLRMAEALLARQIADLEADLEAGRLGPKEKPTQRTSDTLEAGRRKLAQLREVREEARAASPEYQAKMEARRNAQYKKSLERQLAFWEKRLAEAKRGILPKKRVKKTPEDMEILKKGMEIAAIKKRVAAEIERAKWAELTRLQKALRIPGSVARGLKAYWSAFDASFMLRQGRSLTLSHPIKAIKAQGPATKAQFSSLRFFEVMEDAKNRTNARNGVYDRMKLELGTIEGTKTEREEMFQSTWAEQVYFVGAGVRASERAFVAQAVQQRADVADAMLAYMLQTDPTDATDAELEIIGNYVNVVSWRGDVGRFAATAADLGGVFWTPRGYVGKFQYITGQPFFKKGGQGSARVRKAIAREYARAMAGQALFIGTAASFLFATLGPPSDDPDGWDIGLNPWGPHPGRLRIKERYIDFAGGLGQTIRITARLSRNTVNGIWKLLGGEISEESEKEMKNTWKTIGWYALGKTSPLIGLTGEVLTGKDFDRRDVTPFGLGSSIAIPLTPNDIYESMRDLSVPVGVAAAILAYYGAGGSSYGPRTKYLESDPEERKELFKKHLKQMQWDSGPLAYSEFLTPKQMKQAEARVEERKQSVVSEGLKPEPKRSYHDTDESHQKKLEQRKKAQERFQEMIKTLNLSHTKAHQLLVDSCRGRDDEGKIQTEMRGSTSNFDPKAYKAKAYALAKLYGKPATLEALLALRKQPGFVTIEAFRAKENK